MTERVRTDTERLDWLEENALSLGPVDVPTGGGDADVGWKVREFTMGRSYQRDLSFAMRLRAAIDEAMDATQETEGVGR